MRPKSTFDLPRICFLHNLRSTLQCALRAPLLSLLCCHPMYLKVIEGLLEEVVSKLSFQSLIKVFKTDVYMKRQEIRWFKLGSENSMCKSRRA